MSQKGLTKREAETLLKKYGKNELTSEDKTSAWVLFAKQFTSPLMILLIIAAIVSWLIGYLPGQNSNAIDTILIGAIVILSAVLGFFQEYKAEKAVEALQKMSAPKSTVIRDAKEQNIPTGEIVPGDLVVLDEGDVIPADCQIIDSNYLEINEAPLTGESQPVSKKINDGIFMQTYVLSGNGKALVIKTGMQTKVGKIAGKLEEIKEEQTPFEDDLNKFSKKIFWLILGIIVIIGGISIFKYSLYTSILTAISLAVAAIPEGLPAVIALTLAIGSKSMSRKNALVKKFSVAESIGAIDIICTDKTGTLTKNEMKVTRIYANSKEYNSDKIPKNIDKELGKLFLCGALCTKVKIITEKKKAKNFSDPTEVALIEIAKENGYDKKILERDYLKIHEIPFSSQRKMMSVVFEKKGAKTMFTKGAPEVIINKCKKIYFNGIVKILDTKTKKDILEKNKNTASNGLRVLGFAFKEISGNKYGEDSLIWIGLQAMIDPARKEVKRALKECRTAGIRVMMLTGDNPLTAKAIAEEIGLQSKGEIIGDDLEKLSDIELKKQIDSGINIFARVSPNHKLRILELLKKTSRVAMTGDGVNDALALKKADVGISMGIRGTEVAKQASDIILLDDNFATIVEAVKGGRRIFDNIQKFVNYLFVSNLAEVLVIFIATLVWSFKEPVLLPVQLLWINLLTDGLPALALGADPIRPRAMQEPPRKKGESIINKQLSWVIGVIGVKKTIILLATFIITLPLGLDIARTTLFTGFIFYEFVRIGTIRKQEKLNWFSNKLLLGALVLSVILQIALIYSPLAGYFGIVPLGVFSWTVLICGIIVGYALAIWLTGIIIKKVKK